MSRFGGLLPCFGLCLVAACGKEQTFPDAAPQIDAVSIDANSTPDATPSGDVTVTTYARCCADPSGTLKADVTVVSVQPDGTAGPTGKTDANGEIVLQGLRLGASISAIYDVAGDYQIVTTLGVKPGDHLTFGEHFDLSAGSATGNVTVNFPDRPDAASVGIYNRCTGALLNLDGQTQITMPVYCAYPTLDSLLVAYDAQGAILASGLIKNMPYTDGQSATLATWTEGSKTQAVSVSGLIDAVTSTYIYAEQITSGGYAWGNSNYVTPEANAATTSFVHPVGFDAVYSYVTMSRSGQTGSQESYRRDPGASTTAAHTAPSMPWLGQLTINTTAQVAQWIPIGTGSYDGAVAFASWNRYDANQERYVYYYWTISVPPGVTSLSWAGLPTEVAAVLPSEGDAVNGDLQLVDLSQANGYDGLRATPEWDWTCVGCASERGDLTGPAAISYSYGGAEGAPAVVSRTPTYHRPPLLRPHR